MLSYTPHMATQQIKFHHGGAKIWVGGVAGEGEFVGRRGVERRERERERHTHRRGT